SSATSATAERPFPRQRQRKTGVHREPMSNLVEEHLVDGAPPAPLVALGGASHLRDAANSVEVLRGGHLRVNFLPPRRRGPRPKLRSPSPSVGALRVPAAGGRAAHHESSARPDRLSHPCLQESSGKSAEFASSSAPLFGTTRAPWRSVTFECGPLLLRCTA